MSPYKTDGKKFKMCDELMRLENRNMVFLIRGTDRFLKIVEVIE